MSTAVIDNFSPRLEKVQKLKREITQAQKGRVAEHRCRALAGNIMQLTSLVEKSWSSLSRDEQEVLKDMAYSISKPKKPTPWQFFQGVYTLFRAHKYGYYSCFQMLVDSVDKLVDSIFSAIEREDLSECTIDFDTLSESSCFDSPEYGTCSEEIGDWLNSLSSSALE
ncbi:hypothetical protein IQ260_04415 [Leptolyngbya cf. ectocarpi LEGE 11479]|uniref:Uncharacterized protein n=1 Tax=Leptolyngbya cf. ectocarpi LEGE 11479 TaxID=1828722 RepID=A0A928ZSW2_LEPEC|nr:hypothetical protein [Leptolyngbya ectocarpi]MBE9065891.1 hypothetical protein [Leptolyngbya cf. ectocarpi LEGE 11479]